MLLVSPPCRPVGSPWSIRQRRWERRSRQDVRWLSVAPMHEAYRTPRRRQPETSTLRLEQALPWTLRPLLASLRWFQVGVERGRHPVVVAALRHRDGAPRGRRERPGTRAHAGGALAVDGIRLRLDAEH